MVLYKKSILQNIAGSKNERFMQNKVSAFVSKWTNTKPLTRTIKKSFALLLIPHCTVNCSDVNYNLNLVKPIINKGYLWDLLVAERTIHIFTFNWSFSKHIIIFQFPNNHGPKRICTPFVEKIYDAPLLLI